MFTEIQNTFNTNFNVHVIFTFLNYLFLAGQIITLFYGKLFIFNSMYVTLCNNKPVTGHYNRIKYKPQQSNLTCHNHKQLIEHFKAQMLYIRRLFKIKKR